MTNQPKGIISSVLSPACRAWLKSQVSQVEQLDVNIAGGSRQILGGTIPRVAVVATEAVYQGLWLDSINLIAENIRINLPQVLRGQALRLLEPIAITAAARLTEVGVQASLGAPMLSIAINDLLSQILATEQLKTDWRVNWRTIRIVPQQLILQGGLTTGDRTAPIEISMGINLLGKHILQLDPIRIICAIDLPGSEITSYQIDLGTDVHLTQLTLGTGELICQGRIQVNP